MNQKLLNAKIPPRFQGASLKDFAELFRREPETKSIIHEFLWGEGIWTSRTINGSEYWQDSKWRVLLIAGNVGIGKSHLACAMAGEYCKRGWPVYTTVYAMSQDIMASKSAKRYKGCGLLIIDEIGRGFDTTAEEKRFFDLINHRYEHMQPVILCGNIKPKELRAAVGEAIADRMAENLTVITMAGQSRRTSK